MPDNLYTPTPIVIPDDVPYKRKYVNDFDFQLGKGLEDISACDFKTVFYDVFFRCNTRNICAVGPPLLNLAEELPFKIIYKGHELPYHLEHFRECSMLKVHEELQDEEVDLLFDFKHFTKTIRVKKEKFPHSKLAVVCIQRNSRPRWVRSWCEWYVRLFNASVFLYDNGSDNFSETFEAIKDLNPTVIKWNFKFGPYTTYHIFFAQLGAYNHFLLKYNFQYGMVFDIDEYLISKVHLLDYVRSHKDVSLFHLDSYFIPNVREDKLDFGIEDFKYRPKQLREKNLKYIFLREHARYLNVHDATMAEGNKSFVLPDIMYFNHYKGLTIHWRPWDRPDRIDTITSDLVPDVEAKKSIDRLGLGAK